MTYVNFEAYTLIELMDNMDSKTVKILRYLAEQAMMNSDGFSVTYKDIEDELNIGHTTIGKNMRLFVRLGLLNKIAPSTYTINKELLNIVAITEAF